MFERKPPELHEYKEMAKNLLEYVPTNEKMGLLAIAGDPVSLDDCRP